MLTNTCMVKGCTNVAICQVRIDHDEWTDMCAKHEHEWMTDYLFYDDIGLTYDSYEEIIGK